MNCNHKRVWETAEASLARLVGGDDMVYEPVWERDDSGRNKLLADSWEPYTVVANTMFFKRLKPCEECPKVLERAREEVEKLRKEHSKHIQKVHEARWERMRNQGLVD